MNIEKIRDDFPILKRTVDGKELIYLDSAATSQKPKQVIEATREYYESYNANIMRGLHTLGEEATEAYENSRKKIKEFIGANKEREIIFTKNSTEGFNLVMYSWGRENIKKDDKIILSTSEHHANLIPWQQLAIEKEAKLEYLEIDENGVLKQGWEEKIKGAKILAITHVSNVLGVINNIKNICKIAKEEDVRTVVDGSQSAPHMKIDMNNIDCDFFVFTGHKMLGPTGIGVLYGKEELLEEMKPFLYGGEMIKTAHKFNSEWNELPHKFEAGTPNIAGVIGLGVAVDYLNEIGMEEIRNHEKELIKHTLEKFSELKNIEMIGSREYSEQKAGILSFNIMGVHAHDVGSMLNEQGIAVRSGFHCAQPFHEELKIKSSVRASVYLYNQIKEIDRLVEEIKKISNVLV